MTRTGAATTVVVVLATAVAAVFALLSAFAFGAVLSVLVGGLWLHTALSLIANQLAISDMQHINARVDETLQRVKKLTRTVNDTAGSVGRSAPLVREIKKTVREIEQRSSHDGESSGSLTGPAKFPPMRTVPRPLASSLKVMMIADEFTAMAFAPEWEQHLPTPENWRQVMDDAQPDLFFIESAWEGNSGTWKYHLVGSSAPRPAVTEAIDEAQRRGIPVILWNKEDPPHFDDFLPLARLVDVVFTTDGDLIPTYRRELGHDRVHVLPFAAQPAMHNPAQLKGRARDREVAFGGMYFQHKYPERREQLNYLLPAASKFEFDIFSRQFGGDPRYQFPKPFDEFVRGSLSYQEMVSAYHAYKVVLNVNSVVGSSTMFARRIFEATACGASVVTPPSAAIDAFFPGGVISTVANEVDTAETIRILVKSDEYRDRLAHRAQREIWQRHTYRHRAETIAQATGLDLPVQSSDVSVIISTNRPDHAQAIVDNVARQSMRPQQVVVVSHGFEFPREAFAVLSSMGIELELAQAPNDWSLGRNLNHAVELASGDIVVRMDDDDWYGANYVGDMMNALMFSGAELAGKASTFIYFEALNHTVLTMPLKEHKYGDFVRGATFVARKSMFQEYPFAELGRGEDSSVLTRLKSDGAQIYSADRFNFVVNRKQDKSRHTWSVSDRSLYSTGVMKYIGDGRDQIEV